MPRPPSSTLFPYTTLFRSVRKSFLAQPSHRWQFDHRRNCQGIPRDFRGRGGSQEAGRLRQFGDRKSTRLNSSHVAISYAVFCLKKKNNLSLASDRDLLTNY